MKHTILIVALCAFAPSALAQAMPSDPASNLAQDFEAFSILHKHVFDDIQSLAQESQQQKKQIDDLTKQLAAEKAKNALPPVAPDSP